MKIIFVLIFLVSLSVNSAQIFYKNGEENTVKIISIKENNIVYNDGETKEVSTGEVLRIEYREKRIDDEKQDLRDFDPEYIKLISQSPGKIEYPDSEVITLFQKTFVEFSVDGGYSLTTRSIVKVLKESGEDVADGAVYYFSDTQKAHIDFARMILPDGKVIHLLDSAVEESDVYGSYPEYNRLKSIKYSVAGVCPGAVMDVQKTIKCNKVSWNEPFYSEIIFQKKNPVLKAVFSAKWPENFEVLYETGKVNPENITEISNGGHKALIVEVSDIKRLEFESYFPPLRNVAPFIVFGAGIIDDDKCLKDYEKVYKKSEVNLKNWIEKEIPDHKSELGYMKIYEFVTKKIRKISQLPGSFRYIPNSPEMILEKKQGNILDLNFLLYSLLRISGKNAELIFCAPDSYGKPLVKIKSLSQFSIPGVKLNINEIPCFLFAQYKNLKAGAIPSGMENSCYISIWNFEELNYIGKQNLWDERAFNHNEVFVNANGDMRIITKEDTGFQFQADMRNYLESISREKMLVDFQKKVSAFHNNAELIGCTIENLDDVNKPLILIYEFILKDYLLRSGEKRFAFKLPFIDYNAMEVGKNTRDYPVYFESRRLNGNRAIIFLPKEFSVLSLPESVHESNLFCSYNGSYSRSGDLIYFEDTYLREHRKGTEESYFDVKKVVEKRASFSKEWIVIEKK